MMPSRKALNVIRGVASVEPCRWNLSATHTSPAASLTATAVLGTGVHPVSEVGARLKLAAEAGCRWLERRRCVLARRGEFAKSGVEEFSRGARDSKVAETVADERSRS
jgi:hypothetical protein